jgi:hypothetical protein
MEKSGMKLENTHGLTCAYVANKPGQKPMCIVLQKGRLQHG